MNFFGIVRYWILFFGIVGFWLPSKAQNLQILDPEGNRVDGDTVSVFFHPGPDHGWTEIYLFLKVKNTGDSTLTIVAKKQEYNIQSGEYHAICFGGSCFDSTVFTSPVSIVLNPGQTDSSFSGHFRFDDLIHTPGKCFVGYFFHAENSPGDSAQVTVIYDTETFSSVLEVNAEPNNWNLYPNPCLDGFVQVSGNQPGKYRFEVMNQSGKLVVEKEMEDSGQIDLKGLDPGFYLYRFSGDWWSGRWKPLIR